MWKVIRLLRHSKLVSKEAFCTGYRSLVASFGFIDTHTRRFHVESPETIKLRER